MKNTEGNDHVDYHEFDSDSMKSCSSTDCTGLIPTLPQDEAELEAYEELYSFLPKASSSPKG